ncbi:MAG: hypothetical protein HYZ33_03195, partial [Ignavibacteriales bacterium]|nr:hypothetical protein [Ignavibacteriales bacterium]
MTRTFITRTTALWLFCSFFASMLFGQSTTDSLLSLERIFLKPYIAGTRPSNPVLSNDGGFLLFSWDDKAMNKYRNWLMNSDGSGLHQIADTTIGEIELSTDSRTVACTRNGDIFITDTSFATFERVTKTQSWEGGLRWSP